MLEVSESPGSLQITSPMPVGRRVLFGLLALLPLLAPYELLLKPGWQNILNPFFGVAAVVSFGAILVSAFLLWAAVAGLASRATFDRERLTLTTAFWAPIVPLTVRTYSLNDLRSVCLEETAWSEGSPSYSLVVQTSDGRKLRLMGDHDRSELEDIHSRITRFLSGSDRG